MTSKPTCDATSKRSGERCQLSPCIGLTKCATHCGLSKAERKRIAEDYRLMQQGARELAKLDVVPITNSLAELQWLAGVAHAWLQTAARLVNRLREDELRYEGRLHGEMLRAEVALLERSMERVATINSRIAKLNIEDRLTTVKERDARELVDAFNAVLRAVGITEGDAWRASHHDFANRLRAIHAARQVEPSPWQDIPRRNHPKRQHRITTAEERAPALMAAALCRSPHGRPAPACARAGRGCAVPRLRQVPLPGALPPLVHV